MPNRSELEEVERELITELYPALRRIAAVAGSVDIEPDDLVQEALVRTLSRRNLADLENPLLGAQVEVGDCSMANYDDEVCDLRYTDAMTEAAGLDSTINKTVFTGWSVGEGPVVVNGLIRAVTLMGDDLHLECGYLGSQRERGSRI